MFNPISFTPHRLIYRNPEKRPCPREVRKSLAAGEEVLEANAKLLDLAKKTITQDPLPERREFPVDPGVQKKKPNVDPDIIGENMALLMGTPEGGPEHLMDHEEQWLMRDVNALAGKYLIQIDFNEYLQRTGSGDLQEAVQLLMEYPHDFHYTRTKDAQGEVIVIQERNRVFSAAPNNPAIPNNFEVKLRIPESLEPHPLENVDFMANAYITHINGVNILQQGAPTWALGEAENQQERMNLHTQYFNEVAERAEGIVREDMNRPEEERRTNKEVVQEAIKQVDPNLLEHHLQVAKQFPERVAKLMQLWQKIGILNAQNLPEGVEWLAQKVQESPEGVPSEIIVTPVPNNQGKELLWLWDIDSPEELGLVINEFGMPMQMNENGEWMEALDGSYFDENLHELHGRLEQELNQATEQQIRDLAKYIAEQMPEEQKERLNDPEQSKEDLTKLILEITPQSQLNATIEHLDFLKHFEPLETE